MTSLKYLKISQLFKQLIVDLKPPKERLKIHIDIKKIRKSELAEHLKNKSDYDLLFEKLTTGGLEIEPYEHVIELSKKDGTKLEKLEMNRMLSDLGYNINVIFSKNHKADYSAAINVNGYSIPGWETLINFLRKFNTNIAIFLGKRFAPGKSRLHILLFEGVKNFYIIAHIDVFSWTNFNIRGVLKSHHGSGQGDYKDGLEYFIKSLNYYLNK